MILHGNQRGGAKDLAIHLLKPDNEHVEIHQIRGFAAQDLRGAFLESEALSKATRCRQHLFSMSLNPPQHEKVPVQEFENAIDQAEERLGLTGQPRVIVFHEKEGRRHAHAVWSRIDPEGMTARQLSFSKLKMRELSRDLFRDHGWDMPRGLMNREDRSLQNFTLEQWQQAKRTETDPRRVKADLYDAWSQSDDRPSYEAALKQRGYLLARGDKRAFVAVGLHGEVYAISRWTGIKSKDVKAKLGDPKTQRSVEDARTAITYEVSDTLKRLRAEDAEKARIAREDHRRRVQVMTERHRQERKQLEQFQARRSRQEHHIRQARFATGVAGIWQLVTGKRKAIERQNLDEARCSFLRDRAERDDLICRQLEQRQAISARTFDMQREFVGRHRELHRNNLQRTAPCPVAFHQQRK